MTLSRCVFCLAAGGCEVRFDKRARPYLSCRHCSTRAFVRNLEALYGLAIAPKLLDAAISQRSTDEEYRKWFDGEISSLIATVRSARPSEVVPGLPSVACVPFEAEKAS